jgi:hypothetical protein
VVANVGRRLGCAIALHTVALAHLLALTFEMAFRDTIDP